jgi:hypothetical protein
MDQAKEDRPLIRTNECMAEEQSHTAALLDKLAARLEPVLRYPEPQKDEGAAKGVGGETPLHTQMLERCMYQRYINERLAELIRRVT